MNTLSTGKRTSQWVRKLVMLILCGLPSLAIATFTVSTQPGSAFDTVVTDVPWDEGGANPIDDDARVEALGFSFDFQGTAFTQVRIISNGALQFGAASGFHDVFTNTALPVAGHDNLLLGLWDDLNLAAGACGANANCFVRFGTLGVAPNRRFVVHWSEVPLFNDASARCSFQMVLFESGEIRYRYDPASVNCDNTTANSSMTVGAEETDANFDQFLFNTPLNLNDDVVYSQAAPPTSGNITVTLTGNVDEINAGSIVITGAASGLPEATATNSNSATATITTNIVTINNNTLLIDMVGSGNAGSFTPGGGQTEQFDTAANSATGAMSTLVVPGAGASSMTQTHSTNSNRTAHAVVGATANVLASAPVVFSQNSANTTGTSTLSWVQTAPGTRASAKIFVGIGVEVANCAGNENVTSVTYGTLSLSRVATSSIFTTFCQHVEIWSADIPLLVVSTQGNATIGTVGPLNIQRDEAAGYDGVEDIASLFLDDTIFVGANERIDALHVLDSGNIIISTADNANLVSGGPVIDDADLVEIMPDGTFVSVLMDSSEFAANEDIDAVWVRDNGNIVLSTQGNATLGGVNFRDDDVVEYDPVSNTFIGFLFDGSVHIPNQGGDEDVDAVHVLDDGNLLLSVTANHSVAGTAFLDGDVFLFDVTNNVASPYLPESVYTANEETDAFSFQVDAVAAPVLDHFDVSFVPAASTCLASEIVIEAKDAGGTTLTGYAGTVTLTTSTNNGDWSKLDETSSPSSDPAEGTLTPGGSDSGAATYTFVPGVGVGLDAGDIAVFLANQHAESLTISVNDAVEGVTSTTVATLNFADNAFVLTPLTCSGASCPGTGSDNVVAGRDHTYQIQMVRRDTSLAPPVCGIATNYTGDRVLKGWIERDVTDPGGTLPTLVEQTAALGDGGPTGADNLLVNFDAPPGESTITLQTTDVGRYVLNIRDDSTTFAAGDIDGATSDAVVRAFGFHVSASGNPGAVDENGSVFTSAGQPFAIDVQAVRWDSSDDDGLVSGNAVGVANDGVPDGHEVGDNDPNNNSDLSNNAPTTSYGQENPSAETLVLSALLDQPGVFDPGLSGTTTLGSFVGGLGTTAAAQYNEVGIIEIRAALAGDGVYLGGDTIQGVSGFVGRFIPDHFEVTLVSLDNRDVLACAPASTFSYMDEVFGLNFNLTAVNTASTTTRNYDGVFAKLPISVAAMNYGALDLGAPTPLSSRLSVVSTTGAFVEGVAAIDATMGLGRNSVVDGPFDDFNVGIAPSDSDSVEMGTLDLDTDNNAVDDRAGVSTGTIRVGRLEIQSAFGSEIVDLPVAMRTEFFDGSQFVVNTDDDCTPIAPTDLILSSTFEAAQTDADVIVSGGGSCPGPGGGCSTASIGNNPLSAGVGNLSMSAPGAGNVGFADITVDLNVLGLSYLQFDRDGLGSFDDDPSARVTFGIFSGSRVIIYRREPFN